MLPLASDSQHFTKAPHLTVGIRSTEAVAQLTIPNRVPQPKRRLLVGASLGEFEAMLEAFLAAVRPVLSADSGAKPYVEIVQRHWPKGMAAPSVYDAELVFDPRTASGADGIAAQPEWIGAAFDATHNGEANLQIAIGVRFPYGASTTVATPAFTEVVAKVFAATDVILKRVRS